jgi:hypothetical protein
MFHFNLGLFSFCLIRTFIMFESKGKETVIKIIESRSRQSFRRIEKRTVFASFFKYR